MRGVDPQTVVVEQLLDVLHDLLLALAVNEWVVTDLHRLLIPRGTSCRQLLELHYVRAIRRPAAHQSATGQFYTKYPPPVMRRFADSKNRLCFY